MTKSAISRRRFVGTTAAATAGISVVPFSYSFTTRKKKPNSKVNGVQLGLTTYSYLSMPHGLEEVLEYVLKAGVNALEMRRVLEEGLGIPAGPPRMRRGTQLSDKECTSLLTPLKNDEPLKGQSVFNNILFGKMKTDETLPNEKVNQAIIRLLIEEDCLEDVAEAGMQYNVGNMGDNLSGGQRQKLAIARVLLKEPKVILMDEATSALDNTSQARIQRLIERWKGERTVIAVVHRLDTIKHFDAVGVVVHFRGASAVGR